jgi:hypothetical protein
MMAKKNQYIPLPCPRCRQGMYHSQRALSLHLNKCVNDLYQVASTCTPAKRGQLSQLTNAQRAHQIIQSLKTPHVSGTCRNVDRLFVPTALSSTMAAIPTPPDIDNHTIEFDNFHDDSNDAMNDWAAIPSNDNPHHSTAVPANDDNASIASNITPRRHVNLPSGVQFGIHLQHILSAHRGVDLKLFDEITDLISVHANVHKTDFASAKLYHRNELTSAVSSLYNLQHLKHTIYQVKLTDSSVVSVPVFDVKTVILSILQDPKRMQQDNFACGYDLFTGCATEPITHLNEVHTGALWSVARDHYCHGVQNAFPLGLICFYDKTHTDLFGSLSCAPFIMTFSFFNEHARSRDEFYEVLAYIPNLSYGSGKSNTKLPRDKLQDEHKCLKLITDQLRQLASGFEAVVLGKQVTIKPWIHFIAGDTSGHNNIVGQFNSSSASFPYRDCMCTKSQLCNPVPQCALIKLSDYACHKQNTSLHQMSLHDINNSFIDLPFGDPVHGVFGCVPAEMLHVSGNGIMQYILDVINSIIGLGKNKQMSLHLLDTLHQNMVRDALLQSERDMPRMSDRNGVTDGTKMSASERVGNIFILLCAMHTRDGEHLFADGCTEADVSLEEMKHCLKLQLSFERWINDSNSIVDVQRASKLLAELITLIQKCFPRTIGNGWCIPKIHSLSKMIHYVQQFGKAKNFCGQVGERVLKTVVKNHAQQTQRRINVFASQCADRQFEASIYKYAYEDMSESITGKYFKKNTMSDDNLECRGKHSMFFTKSDNRGRGDVQVTWADRARIGNVRPHDIVQFALRTHACANGWTEEFTVLCYTSVRIILPDREEPTLFHANPSIYGNERYQFCMVHFSDDSDLETKKYCPARILSFVRFTTKQFPTPDTHDDSVYAVIHTAAHYMSWEKLDREFICGFTLGDLKTCVYIVNVRTITDPLFVCRNYGKAANHYFCSLPYRQWGNYFQNRIR